jgi:glycosyltransferase involved in cell wall biosynthesis
MLGTGLLYKRREQEIMKNLCREPRIVFINQMAGPLFRELAEDISEKWPPCILLTGHADTLEKAGQSGSLCIEAAPEYDRNSNLSRLVSGLHFIFYAFLQCCRSPKNSLLFLLSTPLCLGIIGYLFKRLRGQRYVILVHDIYPDTLVTCGLLKESGLVTRLWHQMNRLAWENAEIVFAIGNRMAKNLERRFDVTKTATKGVVTIHNWANTEWIGPMAKAENEFAKKYGQVGKLTVMYSGNLGHTHDIETILVAAKKLKEVHSVHFMIIGEGSKRRMVEEWKFKNNLKNLTILPFQPESVLPASLSTADIAIITLDRGSEGLSVPSKTHYCMAAGSALLGICDENSEMAQMITRYDCGLFVKPGDNDSVVNNILNLLQNKPKLGCYRTNSRKAAQEHHSRKNTRSYIDALSAAALIH